jgi:hypothetical protein
MFKRALFLPPREQRKDLSGSIWGKYLLPDALDQNRAEIHIIKQAMQSMVIIAIIFLILFLEVYKSQKALDFLFVRIPYFEAGTVKNLIIYYNRLLITIMICGVLPFFILKLHLNFNAKKNDVLYNKIFWQRNRRKRYVILPFFLVILGILLFACWTLFQISDLWILRNFYAETSGSLVFFSLLSAFLSACILEGYLVVYLVLWRYVGSYDKSTEEHMDIYF